MNPDEPSPDPEPADKKERSEPFANNVKSRSTWLRLFFMIVVVLLAGISRVVVGAVVVLQFFHVLFTGENNKRSGAARTVTGNLHIPDNSLPDLQYRGAAVSFRCELADGTP